MPLVPLPTRPTGLLHRYAARYSRYSRNWCTDYGYFDDRERLVIEYAEAATATPVDIGDMLSERLRRTFEQNERERVHV